MSEDGRISVSREHAVATVWFDRPHARNSMTTVMYKQLADACQQLAADKGVRLVIFRGVGGKSFVAGTDIARFRSFASGEDGLSYERELEAHLQSLFAIPVPTIAVIEGYAVGGGLAIAGACDLRIAVHGAKFGVPIAKTLGNCLAMPNYARTLAAFGESRAKRMLLLADLLTAEEAQEAGFLARLVAPEALDECLAEVVAQLLANAPLTLEVSKEAIRRLQERDLPDGDDLIRRIYGSADFKTGVAAFTGKTKPVWQGK